ncbi:hypothetical protein IMG5_119690 [Ichthyophthirius multifiliis]|uniref:Transmembrane protein n=1 Tax=Ichthyophthirius multifiliis TaxID=5932 RepID=G0QUW0_ICHMU|nr:hypothetical protein IMG5_119690 [Ichthyophthirius multifiliis]EGR31001.1 hypothetical protein IMG5_119690 [Ichthyophthirius multifiliis]|eukprot:XP_004034487.1 hypothetical protein IMG5_119690 [Ichthyophthirius multifiliis]
MQQILIIIWFFLKPDLIKIVFLLKNLRKFEFYAQQYLISTFSEFSISQIQQKIQAFQSNHNVSVLLSIQTTLQIQPVFRLCSVQVLFQIQCSILLNFLSFIGSFCCLFSLIYCDY